VSWRPKQIAESFVAEEIEALVSDLELRLLSFAHLAAYRRRLRWIGRIFNRNEIFLLHALDKLFDQFIELAFHLHLPEAFPHFFIEKIAVHQRLLDRAAKGIEVLIALGHLVEHVILESALQKIVGQSAEQVFHAHLAGGIGNVFGVADAFHKCSRRSSVVSRQQSGLWSIADWWWRSIFAGMDRPAVGCLVYSMTVQLSAISQRPSANS